MVDRREGESQPAAEIPDFIRWWHQRCHYSGFRSYGSIACMFVIMGAFPRLEDVQERADGAVKAGDGACGKLAQVRLEFAVRQFDRVEVG